ncbi:MAG: DMT family transporter [Deltaproteobacteria bacterium]|nr:DMT family transporter [Deltaproteobacteria bacterium]
MAAACVAFAAMGAFVKALGLRIPYEEAVFFRSLLGLPLLAGLLVRRRVSLRPRRPSLMVLRSFYGLSAMLCTFYALQRGKLAEVTVVSLTQPILVAVLARLWLKERTAKSAALAMLVGGVGVILVAKPSAQLVSPAVLAALLATLLSALAHITVRRLSSSDSPELIVTFFSLAGVLVGGLLALPRFVRPSPLDLGLLTGAGLSATLGQILMTTAYAREEAPVVATVGSVQLAVALVLGWALWGELPDLLSWLGSALIVGSSLLLGMSRRASVDQHS